LTNSNIYGSNQSGVSHGVSQKPHSKPLILKVSFWSKIGTVNRTRVMHLLDFPHVFLPWIAAGITFIAVFLYKFLQFALGWPWESWEQALFDLAGMLGLSVLAFLIAQVFQRSIQERRQIREQLETQVRMAEQANQRLAAVFRLRKQFIEASEENEIIDWLLRLSVEAAGGRGGSFVPLDEHGQPLAAYGYGDAPPPVTEAWVEYLASPAVRDRCKVCENYNHLSTSCPLLKGPFADAVGIYCLPVRRGEREFGVLNLYLVDADKLGIETRMFLQSLVDETAVGLEGVWLRKRELSALRQLQSVRQKSDLTSLLSGLLENVQTTLEADFAFLVVRSSGESDLLSVVDASKGYQEKTYCGEFPTQARAFVDGIVQGVIESGEPVNLSSNTVDSSVQPGVRAVLAVPLLSVDQSPLGALLVGNRRAKNFHQRQLTLMLTVAGQISLVVQNTRQLSELQYKTMMEERTRLAREIHDGLAQTLGFLKLQTAQMLGYLERGDVGKLKQSIQTYYETLSVAYEDARYAIDGLRISPAGNRLNTWIEQTLNEFLDNPGMSQLDASLECMEVNSEILSEVQAQLIRILQEALSNVRKHAAARHVWISCYEQERDLVMEIRDDGCGFSPDDVPGHSQHGLRGMRERAELIRADFQVVSRPQEGTTIRVCLPMRIGETI
jgi:two-component system, NarL family, nitrate/nitrite sensor histidine kinase NarX